MEKTMLLANSPVVWIFALLIVCTVIFQGFTFIRLATKTSSSVGMSRNEVKSALKIGAINAIGPSIGIIIVAISLIALLGDPLVLMRIGIIGSAATESMGATIAASTFGTELGSDNFSEQAFTTVAWVLCLGGAGWLLVVALFTKSLGKMEKKITEKTKNSTVPVMMIVATAAMLGAFGNLVSGELLKGYTNAIVAIAAAVTMVILTLIANKKKSLNWLNEWSLGFAIIISLTVCYFVV
jgi:hypothetical protein